MCRKGRFATSCISCDCVKEYTGGGGYAEQFYDEDVMANVERIFTIGKTRDHTPPWAKHKR